MRKKRLLSRRREKVRGRVGDRLQEKEGMDG